MKRLILGAVVVGGAVFGLRLLARHGRELCAGCGGSVGHCCQLGGSGRLMACRHLQ